MQVAKNMVVSIHYELSGENGEHIESSHDGGKPIELLIGNGGIIAGLENALIGRSAGESLEVDVSPGEAYGERNEGNMQRVPKKYFRNAASLRPGMGTNLSMKDGGQRMVTVVKVGSSVVDVDLNHPLAGRKLHFDVQILAVREASEVEIAHRHVHGPDGSHPADHH